MVSNLLLNCRIARKCFYVSLGLFGSVCVHAQTDSESGSGEASHMSAATQAGMTGSPKAQTLSDPNSPNTVPEILVPIAMSDTVIFIPVELGDTDIDPTPQCYTYWLEGRHRWEWQGIPGIAMDIEFVMNSNAFYGLGKDPDYCNKPPLEAERLHVEGVVYAAYDNSSQVSHPIYTADKTQNNVSSVRKEEDYYGIGEAADEPCGAVSSHEMDHLGVQVSFLSGSGCASEPFGLH